MTDFQSLGLSAPLAEALAAKGYTSPTPIQAQAIPVVLTGKDLLGIAQTGTGKTASFALPILQRLAAEQKPAPRNSCRALVLSPTRELATQIAESFASYGRNLRISVDVVFGGVGHRPQIQMLSRGIDVLVATPGRLLDHLASGVLNLRETGIFVLDEADQMLDLGFVRPIRRIVSHLPRARQSLFFSATMPHEIAALAAELLDTPARVEVTPAATTVERIAQKVIHIEAAKKRSLLVELLKDAQMGRTLVFTRTKRGADRVAQHLEAAGIEAAAIHGNKSQRQREEALDAFRAARIRVLVATDIAARGIDVSEVTHVVNYELPEVPEVYVHRIGRTGRAGAAGIAISLCDGEERGQLRDIERLTRQSIPSEDRRSDTSLSVEHRSIQRPAGNRGQAGRRQGEGKPHQPRREGDGAHRDRNRAPRQGQDRQDRQQRDGRDRTERTHRDHARPQPQQHARRRHDENGGGARSERSEARTSTEGGSHSMAKLGFMAPSSERPRSGGRPDQRPGNGGGQRKFGGPKGNRQRFAQTR
ncbi:MAG: DEAD/DEAH box helicase [Hyphomicrobiaceae bacterium]